MITINEQNLVSAKEVYNLLNIKHRYNGWIKNSLELINAKESQDFYPRTLDSTGGRPSVDYLLSICTLKKICLMSLKKNGIAIDVYKYLESLDGKEVAITYRTRKEVLFSIDLEEMLKGICTIENQYHIDGYRVDFYIPEYNICIEYDELYHNNDKQIEKDLEREENIKNILYCDFVRVKSGDEIKGINDILKIILVKTTDFNEKSFNKMTKYIFGN